MNDEEDVDAEHAAGANPANGDVVVKRRPEPPEEQRRAVDLLPVCGRYGQPRKSSETRLTRLADTRARFRARSADERLVVGTTRAFLTHVKAVPLVESRRHRPTKQQTIVATRPRTGARLGRACKPLRRQSASVFDDSIRARDNRPPAPRRKRTRDAVLHAVRNRGARVWPRNNANS